MKNYIEYLSKRGLTENEAKIFVYLASKYKPTDEELQLYDESCESDILFEGGHLPFEAMIGLDIKNDDSVSSEEKGYIDNFSSNLNDPQSIIETWPESQGIMECSHSYFVEADENKNQEHIDSAYICELGMFCKCRNKII